MIKHIQACSRMMLIICLLAMSSVRPAFAEAQEISTAAENFIQAIENQTGKRCQLLAFRCGKEKLHIIDQGAGESNDQKQVWREMQLRGLRIMAIYPKTRPASYYLAKITVSKADWPLPLSLNVGSASKDLVKKLGPASFINAEGCQVYFSDRLQTSVSFCSTNARISAITWEAFLD